MHAVRAARAFDGERFLDGATVLFDEGRILGVEGPRHEPPAGCRVATYSGTLLPGLIDAHVHLVADASPGSLERSGAASPDELDATIEQTLRRHASAGVTTVRDLGDVDFRTLAFREPRDGLPRLLAAGPPLTTPRGHCHFLGGAVEGEQGVRAAVAGHAARGVDVIKVMASGGMLTAGSDVTGVQFDPEELRALVEEAHGHGLRVLAHTHSPSGAWHAVRAGVDGLEHFSCLTDAGIECPDELLAAVAVAGIDIDPTAGGDPSRQPPPDQLPPPLLRLTRLLGVTPDRIGEARAPLLRRVREHGIRVVTGTDAGIAPPKDHGIAWRAVTELLLAGFSVAEAVATATSVAADACGVGEVTGRLAPGLAADLLVVDGDVGADPEALGRPVAVWVRGRPLPA